MTTRPTSLAHRPGRTPRWRVGCRAAEARPPITGRRDAAAFFVRTFGCQMNEHDSERIAGLLEADGMEPTDDLDEADVVVLNTCCIRENADNKLYGTSAI